MNQKRTDTISLFSDDEVNADHQRSGRNEENAICILSSDDDDSIVFVETRPANQSSMVARNGAEIFQASQAANGIDQTSNAAMNMEEPLHENPGTRNEEAAPQEPSFPPLHVTCQPEVTPTQATTINKNSFQPSRGLVGDSAAASPSTTIVSRSAAGKDPTRLQFHVPDTANCCNATLPLAQQQDLPSRAPERSLTDPSCQNNQNQIKSEIKAEPVPASCTAPSQSNKGSTERENMPEGDSRAQLGGECHRRMKRVARKSAARAAQLVDAKLEEKDDDGDDSYVEYLLARRMRRHHGRNKDDNIDSLDDDSDDSSFAAIPKNAFSSPNTGDDPVGIPSSVLHRGGELPASFILIPSQDHGLLQVERTPQDVSDLSSVEQKAEGRIEKVDQDENESMPTDSLEGPVEQSHRLMCSRQRRIILDDEEESAEPIQIAQSSDSRPVSESEDSSLADLTIDKEFQGGQDNIPNLKEKLEKVAGLRLEKIASQSWCMGKIEHLCSLGFNKELSLPTYKFSVYNVDETIIYDFDVRVDKSNIPNAGRGVFLQFTGARELKPSRKEWGKNRKSCSRGLPEPLSATYPHGLGVTVKLKGEGFPDPPKRLRIGNTRIYTESDYVQAPRRTFSSLDPKCGAIELGQYGPFRPEDRKTVDLFEVKGFLFSSIPNEWGFDVPQDLDGKNQMIDITDELSGDTHESARRHIPMYVNEVGHDPKLKQSVCALIDEHERNVVYYIVIREPMNPGETVELLVRYNDYYEEIREKKGYGKKNMQGKKKSDDHFGTFLERNSKARTYLKNEIIGEFKPDDIGKMKGWLLATHHSLSEIVDNFLINIKAKPPTKIEDLRKRLETTPLAQQIVALRRFEWIAKLFQQHLQRQKKQARGGTATIDLLERISKLKYSKWNDLILALRRLQGIKDSNGKSLYTAFEREIVSELWYDIGDDKIEKPMTEGLWCGLAMTLTKEICVETAKEIWQRTPRKSSLMQVYIQLAKDAVREIRAEHHVHTLSFVPKFIGLADDAKQKLNSMQETAKGKTGEVLSVLTQVDTVKPLENLRPLGAIPRVLAADSTVQASHSWYICWQVLYLVDSFARTYLKDTTYTFSFLCDQIGIGPDAKENMKAAIEKRYETQKSRAKKRKASFSSPVAQKKKRKPKACKPGGSARQMFFWNVTWKFLKEQCNWRLEHGNRPGDFYAFPPGVTRKNGSNRTHFFDSVKQIKDKIAQDETWKKALVEEEKCSSLYTQLKRTKSLPHLDSTDALVEWIRSEVKKNKI